MTGLWRRIAIRMIGRTFMVLAGSVFLLLLTAAPVEATPGRKGAVTLVPASERISEEEARLSLARLLSYDDHLLDESIREYLHLLRARPGDNTIRRELARIFMRQKKYGDADREFHAVLKMEPDDPEAQRGLGQIALWTGDYPEAIRRFTAILQRSEADAETWLGLARACHWSGRHEPAMTAYERALALMKDPGAEIFSEMGDNLLSGGRLPEAVAHFRRASGMRPDQREFEKKLGLALSWSGEDLEALTVLEKLHGILPKDREIALELARVHFRAKAWSRAQAILTDLARHFPADVDILLELADMASVRGHAGRCRDLYLKVLTLKEKDRTLALRYADRMVLWGDFYGAERLYRAERRIAPTDRDTALKLAALLEAMQRYEEAEGLYDELLIRFPEWEKPLLQLARLKLLEKDDARALLFAERYLAQKPDDAQGLAARADALAGAGRFKEALAVYDMLRKEHDHGITANVRIGKIFLRQQNEQAAMQRFEESLALAPGHIEARFYRAGLQKAAGDAFVQELLDSTRAVHELDQWAQRYAEAGLNAIAIRLYRAALERDADYFPARLALAEILAVDHQYDASLAIYGDLAAAFPGSSKILIGQARVLSWARQFDQAVDLYEHIHELNPADPVPLREMARTAAWGKRYAKSDSAYRRLAADPVDSRLMKAWSALPDRSVDPIFDETFRALENQTSQGSVYTGYEQLRRSFEMAGDGAGSTEARLRFAGLLPVYRIQKSAILEKRAKALARDRRFSRALDVYEDLIVETPGNQEAIFDQAQAACAMGLCDREGDLYRRLLAVDPLHNLARIGLKKQEIRTHPALRLDHWTWRETGRGDLARITRNRTSLGLSFPFWCRYQLRATGLAWHERPDYTDRTYQAEGYRLELDGIVNAYVKGGVGWTHKAYRDRDFSDRDTGYARLLFNLWDGAQIGAGFERTDEIYNYFGLKQGIQADNWWISAASDLTRNLSIKGEARRILYSDDNAGQHYGLAAGYAFTDHPRIFKVILSGEYRQTDRQNLSLFNAAGGLTDMVHPYWTPKDYTAAGLTLEWYHDISKNLFCGGDLHFYDLRVSLGTDSESNPSIKIEGQWHYEFYHHWLIGLQGMIHRSREWNAESLYGTLMYRF